MPRKLKTWKVALLSGRPARKITKTIILGAASDKSDVKQALRRQGIGGEIISITEVK